ncbi:MAG: nickel-dependent hydrogenase large subunit [Zestosphaera sp.]
MVETTHLIEIPLTVEIPVGPQHPALHEPLLLKLHADGERVVKVDVITGYNHRGVERIAEKNSFYRNIFIVGRVCGICNTVHANCYVRALEQLLDVDPPPRAKYLRVLAMELERIHSHLLILAIAAELAGYETLFMYLMRDREYVMKAKEILTGQRVLADYMMVGGVRRDLDEVKVSRLVDLVMRVEERVKYYHKVFQEDATIDRRLRDAGRIKPRDILTHSLVGPIARGSGVRTDIRAQDRYDAYGEIPFNVVTEEYGDSYARAMVRFGELYESITMVNYVLTHLPQGNPVPDERKLPRRFPSSEAFTAVEAPRGELTYYVSSTGGDKPYRVKIRTPSLNNIVNSAFVYVDQMIADVPIILGSFDPCISCMERAVVTDLRSGRSFSVPLKMLGGVGR